MTLPLYHQYPGQLQAQPAYLELDCKRGTIKCDYNGEIGNAVPHNVYHQHAIRFSISNMLTEDDIKAINDDETIIALAKRIRAGYESVWNGHNHIGQFDDDATEAIEELETYCNDLQPSEEYAIYDSGDYYSGLGKHWFLDCIKSTDEDIQETAERLEKEALAGKYFVRGIDDHLTDSLLDYADFSIGSEHREDVASAILRVIAKLQAAE